MFRQESSESFFGYEHVLTNAVVTRFWMVVSKNSCVEVASLAILVIVVVDTTLRQPKAFPATKLNRPTLFAAELLGECYAALLTGEANLLPPSYPTARPATELRCASRFAETCRRE